MRLEMTSGEAGDGPWEEGRLRDADVDCTADDEATEGATEADDEAAAAAAAFLLRAC